MASQEERAKRRARRHNHIAKDLRTPKYKQRIEEDKKKVLIKDLSHADLIRLINSEIEMNDR